MNEMGKIIKDLKNALKELINDCDFNEGDLIVVGCSTSEIIGEKIGNNSVPEIGIELIDVIVPIVKENKLHLATQCCEHLNRALVLERAYARDKGIKEVSVIPYPKAGGSLSSAYYRYLKDPVLAEHIEADGGLDIGDTLIGMHLKHVAIPIRLSIKKIGDANLTAARVRPKLIGGERAKYI